MKSPLAAPGPGAAGFGSSAADGAASGSAVVRSLPLNDRESTIAEFDGYLHTVNNRDGRPYEEKTIVIYLGPAKNLDAWMTINGIEGATTPTPTPGTASTGTRR